jgi:cyclase
MTPYSRGLHELGDGLFAYLQPDGGWGWSNAGLVRGDSQSLLVDTLFDLALTREMLDSMAPITSASPITTVVNTHANGDHCYGNQLVGEAEIITSAATAVGMSDVPPSLLHALMSAELGDELGPYLRHCFGAFDFSNIDPPEPTRTFRGSATVVVDQRVIELIEVGPAHTEGDVIAWVPDAKAVFTGDILFIGGTPIVWAGPLQNWIAACATIDALAPEVIVPGHGPLTNLQGVDDVRRYLEFVGDQARVRFDAGMSSWDAAQDIDLGEFADWGDAERLAVNVDTAYRAFDPAHQPANVVESFRRMAVLHRRSQPAH